MLAAVRRKRRRRRLGLAVGGMTVAIIAIGIGWRLPTPNAIIAPAPAKLTTIVQAPPRQELSDGSVVELKDDAQVSVTFTPTTRRVTLRRGAAHFQVAKDSRRPFVVVAGGAEVRAVGTAFSVHLERENVEVLVREGRVAVAPPRAPGGTGAVEALMMGAGDSCVLDTVRLATGVPSSRTLPPEEMAARLAWRVPRLQLSSTPLADILPLFNQHCASTLVLAEPDLGHLTLSGTLRADNLSVLLEILALTYPVEWRASSTGEIVLSRRHRP